jgi:hypothetical protein
MFGSSAQITKGQAWYDDDPIPVFTADYHDNNYKILYLLKDDIIVTVERKNDQQEKYEYLLLKAFGKNCFVSLYCVAEGELWVAVKTIKREFINKKVTEGNQKRYQAILDETNKPEVILLDTKKSCNNQILHRFKNNTELRTYFMALNNPRDYEEDIKIATGTSPSLPSRLILEPSSLSNEIKVYSKNKLPLKIATQEQAEQLSKSEDVKDLNEIGMYYYSQNPPQIKKSFEIFEKSYNSIPSSRIEAFKSKRFHTEDENDIIEANCGLQVIQTLLKRRAFTVDPLEAIKETDRNAAKRESDLVEFNKVREEENSAINDHSTPIPSNALNPQSATNPQQNP